MSKLCTFKGCSSSATFKCDCIEGTYICVSHISNHMLLEKTHSIISLYVVLDETECEKLIRKSEMLNLFYDLRIQQLNEYSKSLINLIVSETKSQIDDLMKLNSLASRVYKYSKTSSPLDVDDLKLIRSLNEQNNFGFNSQMFNDNLSKNLLSKVKDCNLSKFDSDLRKMIKPKKIKTQEESNLEDDFLFYVTKQGQTIGMIDTLTLKSQKKTLIGDNLRFITSAVQVNKNKYYLTTTKISSDNSNCIFQKIDLNKGTLKDICVLKEMAFNTKVYQNSTFYIFSGRPLTCKIDKSSKEITNLAPLPKSCTFLSSTILNSKILVIGKGLQCIYHFNETENKFEDYIKFDFSSKALIYENWLVGFESFLYEIHENELIKHGNTYCGIVPLCIHSGFKRGKYIYFLERDLMLRRIDTLQKELKSIEYSKLV